MSTTWHVPEDQLDDYRSGRLDPARVMSVEAHLNACGRCRAAFPAGDDWLAQQWHGRHALAGGSGRPASGRRRHHRAA
jgi:anti-sigma factor RsiW